MLLPWDTEFASPSESGWKGLAAKKKGPRSEMGPGVSGTSRETALAEPHPLIERFHS
jgi:hypothetical protein